jgi:hypothetical protein
MSYQCIRDAKGGWGDDKSKVISLHFLSLNSTSSASSNMGVIFFQLIDSIGSSDEFGAKNPG